MSSVIEVCFIYNTSSFFTKKAHVSLFHAAYPANYVLQDMQPEISNMIPKFVLNTFKEPFEQMHHCSIHNWTVGSLRLRAEKGHLQMLVPQQKFLATLSWMGPEVQGCCLFVSFSMLTRVNSCRCRMRLALGISVRDEQFLNGSILTWSVKNSHMPPAFCYFVTRRYNMH